MSDTRSGRGKQRDNIRPDEREAVRTTIVGGRPPGAGRSWGAIPRGIEVLVKKASIDLEFRELLLEKRAEAVKEIGLDLDPAEVLMVNGVPAAQLEAIIERTHVDVESRAAFLGRAAALMLAALGAAPLSCKEHPRGIRPDRTKGIQPDQPVNTAVASKTPAITPSSNIPRPSPAPTATPKPTSTPAPAPTGIRPDRPAEKGKP